MPLFAWETASRPYSRPVAYADAFGPVIPMAEARSIAVDLGLSGPGGLVHEFGLRPLYAGGGTKDGIAVECDLCGGPMGRKDPDEYRYVALSECSDCRE